MIMSFPRKTYMVISLMECPVAPYFCTYSINLKVTERLVSSEEQGAFPVNCLHDHWLLHFETFALQMVGGLT